VIPASLAFGGELCELDNRSLELSRMEMIHFRAKPGEERKAREQGHQKKKDQSRAQVGLGE
jgi:hypothetical protein